MRRSFRDAFLRTLRWHSMCFIHSPLGILHVTPHLIIIEGLRLLGYCRLPIVPKSRCPPLPFFLWRHSSFSCSSPSRLPSSNLFVSQPDRKVTVLRCR